MENCDFDLMWNYFLHMYLYSVGKIFFSKSKIWLDLNNLIMDVRIKSAITNSSQVQKLFLFLQWLVALKITSSCSQLLGFYTQSFISAYSLVTVLQHLFFIFFWLGIVKVFALTIWVLLQKSIELFAVFCVRQLGIEKICNCYSKLYFYS